MAPYDPLKTEDVIYNTRMNQPDPAAFQAGGGYSKEQIQSTASEMNREEMSVNLESMQRLEALRAERAARAAAEAEQRNVAIQTRAAEIARATYEREQQVNRPQQMEAAMMAKNRITEELGQVGRKGGYRQYDPVMGTFREGRPSGFDESMAGRVTEVKQAAGVGPLGQRLVTPLFETEQYTGRAGRPPAPAGLTGDDILNTQTAPMDGQLRQAIMASPGGQIAMARYENQVSTVLGKMQNELVNLTDEFGMVEPKALAEYAAGLPEFNPAMAADVKRAIGAIDATVNQNALNVAKFKQGLTEFEEGVRQFETRERRMDTQAQREADAAALSTFGQSASMFLKPETMPPETSRLLEGGMTPSEIVLRNTKQQVVDPIAEANYKDANIRRTARFLLGEDADLDAADTMDVNIEDDGLVARSVEENLASVYDEVRTGGGDIRANMVTTLAERANVKKMEPAEAMVRLNEIWERVNEYTGQRIEASAMTIRAEQTVRARVGIETAAARIATNAAQFSPTAFQDTFKTESFKQAGDDAGRQSLALGGAFIEMLRGDVEQMFSTANPREIADLQATYNEYLGALGTPMEKRLVDGGDEDFARIVAARDVYVAAGLAQAKSNKSDLEMSTQKAMIDRQQRALWSGGVDKYETITSGNVAYNIPVSARDENGNPAGVDTAITVLKNYSDNWFVKQVLQENTSGSMLSEEGLAQLNRMREPPDPTINSMYGEGIRRNVATSVSTMQEKDPMRQVIQSTDLASIPDMGDKAAFTEVEFAKYYAPVMGIAREIPSGKADVDGTVRTVGEKVNLTETLVRIANENKKELASSGADTSTIESLSKIINEDPLLRDMYYNGETQQSRERAVAGAVLKQRSSIQTKALADVVGVVDPVDRKARNENLVTVIDGLQSKYPDVENEISSVKRRVESIGATSTQPDYAGEIDALGSELNIPKLRGMLSRYDQEMERAAKAYGDRYADINGVDVSIVEEMGQRQFGVKPANEIATDIKQTIDNARAIVQSYDELQASHRQYLDEYTRLTRTTTRPLR